MCVDDMLIRIVPLRQAGLETGYLLRSSCVASTQNQETLRALHGFAGRLLSELTTAPWRQPWN